MMRWVSRSLGCSGWRMICACGCGRAEEIPLFTGIVQDVGKVRARENRGGDAHMVIAFDRLRSGDFRIGDSICVQGCCLTAVELLDDAFTADVSRETLSLTTLGDLAVGSPVNLEPSLKAGDS